MAWFSKEKKLKTREGKPAGPPRPDGSGVWYQCEACSEVSTREEYEKAFNVCPRCGQHDPLPVRRRLELVLDPDSFEELDADLAPARSARLLGLEALPRPPARAPTRPPACATPSSPGGGHRRPPDLGGRLRLRVHGRLHGLGGGREGDSAVFDRATERGIPAVVFTSSGGARMQEGIFSLMQMAKTSAAIHRFRAVRKPYVSVMLHPTTGGVAASFAWLGDVVLAEPKALIGFAGPRVIEQTIREKLPPGFQRSEFLLEHGMIDAIVPRHELRDRLAQILGLLG